jgi:hypothetical protein
MACASLVAATVGVAEMNIIAEENWIEFKSDREPDTAGMIRISRDGRQGQEWTGYEWVEYDAWWLKAVYRAGLEVGRENTLRELGEASDE